MTNFKATNIVVDYRTFQSCSVILYFYLVYVWLYGGIWMLESLCALNGRSLLANISNRKSYCGWNLLCHSIVYVFINAEQLSRFVVWISFNPLPKLRYSRVDSWPIPIATSDSPTNESRQLKAPIATWVCKQFVRH